jgi:hypothetical protein
MAVIAVFEQKLKAIRAPWFAVIVALALLLRLLRTNVAFFASSSARSFTHFYLKVSCHV